MKFQIHRVGKYNPRLLSLKEATKGVSMKIFIGLTIIVLFLGTLSGVRNVQAALVDPLTTIELDTPVHFLAPDGSDLLVEAGTYAIEPAEEWIRLMAGERYEAVLIEAKKGSHELEIEDAIALSIPGAAGGQADNHYVMLLLPGGQSLESTGTYSGIRARGLFTKAFNDVKKNTRRAYRKARSTVRKTTSQVKKTAKRAERQVRKSGKQVMRQAQKGARDIKKGAQRAGKQVQKSARQRMRQAQRAGKQAAAKAERTMRAAQKAAYRAKRQVERTAKKMADDFRTAVINVGNLLTRGHFVGPENSRKCNRWRKGRGFGNKSPGAIGKFRNFRIGSSFQDINNYLLMQASIKTYYEQFNFGPRKDPKARQLDRMDFPRNEDEYRCAATELYKHWGFKKVWFVNSPQSANAIIASNNKMAIIAIRGTQAVFNIKDRTSDSIGNELLEDAKGVADIATTVVNAGVPFVLPTKKGLKVGQIHVGYAAMIPTFVPLLEHAFMKMRIPKNTPIYVTGHSLGASTATLAAFALKILNYKIDAAYVYAPPKVGDLLLNKSIKRTLPLYVTENYRDPVPGIPLLTNVRIQPFFPVMDAARKSVYFDQKHRAVEFGANVNTMSREGKILRDQGRPIPILILTGLESPLSNEWKFHSGNFYTAFAYEKVKRKNFRAAKGTGIAPEYSQRSNMCINRKDTHYDSGKQRTRITHALLQGDKHSNLFTNPRDACKGFSKQIAGTGKKLKKNLRTRR